METKEIKDKVCAEPPSAQRNVYCCRELNNKIPIGIIIYTSSKFSFTSLYMRTTDNATNPS